MTATPLRPGPPRIRNSRCDRIRRVALGGGRMQPDLSKEELREVARRPAGGSPMNFLRDLKSLLSFQALKATVQEFQRDDAMGLAAQLAYYLILALFPFILVLVSLMGTFGSEELASEVLAYFRQVMPEEAYTIIKTFTANIISGKAEAPGLLSFGILFTIWASSGAFAALINALNRAYDVRETRPFWRSEEHTSELQSRQYLVCRLLLEKKKKI